MLSNQRLSNRLMFSLGCFRFIFSRTSNNLKSLTCSWLKNIICQRRHISKVSVSCYLFTNRYKFISNIAPLRLSRATVTKKLKNLYSREMCSEVIDSSEIKAVIVDLSGTIHIEDTAIPGAQEAVERLRQSGLKVKFVTNTTKEPLRTLHERLTGLDFKIDKSEIFTSLTAASNVIRKKDLRPLLFLEDIAKEDFAGISEENPNAVVIGLAPSCFDYEHLTQAFRLLQDGAPLIAIHKARYFKKKDGMYLGPGAFVTGLEYCADVKAEVVGKPEATFFLESLSDLDVSPQNTVMIGDDVRDDVGGAMDVGMKGILVKTGKYREGDEAKINPQPSAVCDDFSQAVEWILSKKS